MRWLDGITESMDVSLSGLPTEGVISFLRLEGGGGCGEPGLERNPQLSLATRMDDWTSLAQHKRKPEILVVTRESRRNSRKTTWLPRHRKMRPLPEHH